MLTAMVLNSSFLKASRGAPSTRLALIYYVIFPELHVNEDQAINQVAATPFWWRFITVIRAAVAEAIFFRGYAIERMQELTGDLRIAAIVPCATSRTQIFPISLPGGGLSFWECGNSFFFDFFVS
jgi:membrane protease YdiL (CAAX protease family)